MLNRKEHFVTECILKLDRWKVLELRTCRFSLFFSVISAPFWRPCILFCCHHGNQLFQPHIHAGLTEEKEGDLPYSLKNSGDLSQAQWDTGLRPEPVRMGRARCQCCWSRLVLGPVPAPVWCHGRRNVSRDKGWPFYFAHREREASGTKAVQGPRLYLSAGANVPKLHPIPSYSGARERLLVTTTQHSQCQATGTLSGKASGQGGVVFTPGPWSPEVLP